MWRPLLSRGAGRETKDWGVEGRESGKKKRMVNSPFVPGEELGVGKLVLARKIRSKANCQPFLGRLPLFSPRPKGLREKIWLAARASVRRVLKKKFVLRRRGRPVAEAAGTVQPGRVALFKSLANRWAARVLFRAGGHAGPSKRWRGGQSRRVRENNSA